MHRRHSLPRAISTERAPRIARATAPTADVFLRITLYAAAALLTLFAARAAAATPRGDDTNRPLVVASPAAAPVPSPALTPDDVVVIVLEALSRNDTPVKDRGISVTFSFSSPANRAFVGPLDRFADLVHDDTYRPLLYHRRAARGVARVTGDRATERVVITTASGERVAYLFTLSRQADGAYKGCWMTDGVMREPASPLTGMRFAD